MLRQNRYKYEDFVVLAEDLMLCKNEILVSEKHDIAIVLEPQQVDIYNELKDFIIEIVKNIPWFDNETQDYYETISDDTDFPHSLAAIYFEGNEVTLDYWSEDVNNQFSIIFQLENSVWLLKRWNIMDVPSDWRNAK
ncbi:hypothetical protein [Acetivibrio cellulolyticus]|uniref:hypothetical protein n=1 Tax=Acetivibrio cellulolyticus TaxID=35830 RepID=UPI0001E2D1AB|nr:hypothetical protein [Acetivibrio cellulolyticus]